jgi:tetratricopeptide (TPR) repeat protein
MGTRWVLGLVLAGGLSACSLDAILEVSDPSRFTDEALDDLNALAAVANGVEGNLHATVDNWAEQSGLLADELMHTGTWAQYEDSDQGRWRPPPQNSQSLVGYGVRTAALKAEERFVRVLGDTAYRTTLMARVKAAEGWRELLSAMTDCEGTDYVKPGEEYGEIVPDNKMYENAVTVLTKAIEIAQAAKSTKYEQFARAGRARAYLMLGKYNEALADAQAIPKGFQYDADFSDASFVNWFVQVDHYTENKAAGLDSRRWSRVDTTSADGKDYYIDKFSGQRDPRVQIVYRVSNRLGVDGVKKFYSQNKYKVRGDDIPMTHWREMRLIEAEVYWKQGNFVQAIAKMNEVRADPCSGCAALPGLVNPNTSAGVLDMLLEERFSTLFLEGHRANDLYRFNLFPSVIGTGYNTKFSMSATEMLNNPKATQPRSCPAVS